MTTRGENAATSTRPKMRLNIGPSVLAMLASAAVLLPLYLATAAPDLTFWDASEFMTAAHTVGIPHPPGTPLWVLLAHVSALAFANNGPARAVTVLSIVATAGACAMGARLVARWLPGRGGVAAGVAAAVAAGTMMSVWDNATETEVYAVSLLLAVAMLSAGEYAGQRIATDDQRMRGRALIAFFVGITVPIHLSALVVFPAVALLAWRGPRIQLREVGWWGALALLGFSAVMILPFRAHHAPSLNMGNPLHWSSLFDVLTRAQYDVPGLLPRRAPWWIQLGNIFEYADWQVALGLRPTVGPSWIRTPITCIWAWFALLGLRSLWKTEARVGRAVAMLLLCGTVGVAVWLNLEAGPSFGHGFLPAGASHEARERDYFFALGFWTWGLLAGSGIAWTATGLTKRMSRSVGNALRAAILILAAIPLVANASVMNRARAPEALMPRLFARLLLESVPTGGLLIAAGDNDTYPLWYLQQVENIRDDVTIVTVPLLGADWYRESLARQRVSPVEVLTGAWPGSEKLLGAIGRGAAKERREIRVSVFLSATERNQLLPASGWALQGLVYAPTDQLPAKTVGLDLAALGKAQAAVPPSFLAKLTVGVDATMDVMQSLLKCTGIKTLADPLLAGVCNGG
ncbi:MAG: DUF2723 domain-containing protein [Gemmatimonadaceae bacterium]